jgi:ABC-2 type transport system ATP-binding protein
VKWHDYLNRLKKMLAVFPISDILDQSPANYSRGNKQKLAIIAAMIHSPGLLVVDEPIVGLDPQSIDEVLTLFLDFAKKGGKILVSTHTLSFVEKVASQVGVIDKGELVFSGKISDLKKQNPKESISSIFKDLVNQHQSI